MSDKVLSSHEDTESETAADFSTSCVEEDALVDRAIIKLREDIFAEVIDRIVNHMMRSDEKVFFANCLKLAWRNVINWMCYSYYDDDLKITKDFEVEPTPIDPSCSGIIPFVHLNAYDKSISQSSQSLVNTGLAGPKEHEDRMSQISKVKRKPCKKRRKKTEPIVSLPPEIKEVNASISELSKISRSYKGVRSTTSRSYTNSMGFGEYRDNKKKKYVKQFQHYISPKSFSTRIMTGRLRVYQGARTEGSSCPGNQSSSVINVKDPLPEELEN